jgi:hypothetical protein
MATITFNNNLLWNPSITKTGGSVTTTTSFTVNGGYNKIVYFIFDPGVEQYNLYVTSASYNGVAMSKLYNPFDPAIGALTQYKSVWYAFNPAVGAHTLSITMNTSGPGTVSPAVMVYAHNYVDQTEGIGSMVTDGLAGIASGGCGDGGQAFYGGNPGFWYGPIGNTIFGNAQNGLLVISGANQLGNNSCYINQHTIFGNTLTGSTVGGAILTGTSSTISPTQSFQLATTPGSGNNASFFMLRTTLELPTVNTPTATVTYKSATMQSTINGNGYATTATIKYGLTSTYSNLITPQSLGTGLAVISGTTISLTANTTYHYSAFADNGNGDIVNSPDTTFTTLPTPTTTTSSASSITATSATFNGFITNGNVAGQHYFEYGTTSGVYTTQTTTTTNTASASQQAISANVSSLTTSVPIYYRSVLVVDGITYTGAQQTFTPGNAPIISLNPITSLLNTSVTLNGLVNSGGIATNYQFQYGTTVALGSSTTLTANGTGTTSLPVTANLTGLTPNTTYYYRLTAVNASGTNFTSIEQFTTDGLPNITSFTVANPIVYTDNTFRFTQEVNAPTATWTIDYGIAPSTYTLSKTGTITTDGVITQEVTGLLPNKTYYARLSITNVYGTTTSSEISFSTYPTMFNTVWTNPDLEPTTIWTNET